MTLAPQQPNLLKQSAAPVADRPLRSSFVAPRQILAPFNGFGQLKLKIRIVTHNPPMIQRPSTSSITMKAAAVSGK